MNALTAMVLLAQASAWVQFEVCQIDSTTTPPTAVRSRDHDVFHIQANKIFAIGEIRPEPQGLECSAIHTASARIFVVGTPEQIMRRLSEKQP